MDDNQVVVKNDMTFQDDDSMNTFLTALYCDMIHDFNKNSIKNNYKVNFRNDFYGFNISRMLNKLKISKSGAGVEKKFSEFCKNEQEIEFHHLSMFMDPDEIKYMVLYNKDIVQNLLQNSKIVRLFREIIDNKIKYIYEYELTRDEEDEIQKELMFINGRSVDEQQEPTSLDPDDRRKGYIMPLHKNMKIRNNNGTEYTLSRFPTTTSNGILRHSFDDNDGVTIGAIQDQDQNQDQNQEQWYSNYSFLPTELCNCTITYLARYSHFQCTSSYFNNKNNYNIFKYVINRTKIKND